MYIPFHPYYFACMAQETVCIVLVVLWLVVVASLFLHNATQPVPHNTTEHKCPILPTRTEGRTSEAARTSRGALGGKAGSHSDTAGTRHCRDTGTASRPSQTTTRTLHGPAPKPSPVSTGPTTPTPCPQTAYSIEAFQKRRGTRALRPHSRHPANSPR